MSLIATLSIYNTQLNDTQQKQWASLCRVSCSECCILWLCWVWWQGILTEGEGSIQL